MGGGQITTGDVTVANETYNRTWAVTDYYYPPIGQGGNTPPVLATAWDATNWGALPAVPDLKRVVVNVTWNDKRGAQAITQARDIAASAAQDQLLAVVEPDDRPTPLVKYTPGQLPDYVPIEFGGKKKETSKPEPDTTQHELNTLTSFDVVTYDTTYNTQRREQFYSLNCVCDLGATGGGYSPVVAVPAPDAENPTHYLDDLGEWVVGKEAGSKPSTGQLGEQFFYCSICCRDHHDENLGNLASYDPFRLSGYNTTSGEHGHFNYNNQGELVEVTTGQYVEACRLKRIDGRIYTATDWNMVALNVFPASYLLDGVDEYQAYVRSLVINYVDDLYDLVAANLNSPQAYIASYRNQDTLVSRNAPGTVFTVPATEPATLGMAVGAEPVQLIARAVYVDYIPPEQMKAIKAALDANDADKVLALTPFYEVNVTRLANWSSSNPLAAQVTSQPITEGAEDTYSRGLVSAVGDGTATIQAVIEPSVTGLTDSNPIDPDDKDQARFFSDAITLLAGSAATAPVPGLTVGGAVNTSEVDPAVAGIQPSEVQVTGLDGAVCQSVSNSTAYECTNVAVSSQVKVSVTLQGNEKNDPGLIKVCFDGPNWSSQLLPTTNDGVQGRYSVIFDLPNQTDAAADIKVVDSTDNCN